MVFILFYMKKPIISLCAIHVTPSMYFTFRSKLTEEGSFLEAKKILGIEHNQASTTKQLVPISCTCAEQG